MATCYIAVGSNVENRKEHIERAINYLQNHPQVLTINSSPLYETVPEEMEPDAPKFLNGALQVQTLLSAHNVMKVLLDIEEELGRPREEKGKKQNRPIDLDLLLFGSDVISEPGLSVPHPRMHERAFVLKPLADLCPQKVVPGIEKTVQELLDECPSLNGIEPYE